ncbi:MAG: phosphoenolpyruvate carboxykinase (ATP) [Solitalea-like symbiont of Tyrophagus putrescentiae]
MNSVETIVKSIGLAHSHEVFYNTEPTELIEHIVINKEGCLADTGAVAINTGRFTGRSPKDRFIVCDKETDTTVDWGQVNIKFESDKYDKLRKKVIEYLNDKQLYIREGFVSSYDKFKITIRLFSEKAYGSLFAYNLFLRPQDDQTSKNIDWTIIFAPGFLADPKIDGTNSSNFAILNFSRQEIIIGGTGYTGEIKKGIFSVINYLLPKKENVLSMHCSANIGADGHTALFFGLSGTGKTTLSTSQDRQLIGDDEHGWHKDNIFNFEGGCYAKCVNLSKENEPTIWNAIKFGSLLENVRFYPGTRKVDYKDISITENTRVSYPLHYVSNALDKSVAPAPKNIFFLTADAFGVFPPISKLTINQARFYFLSGYTAKVAGTEAGINEPTATFSACFGKVFLPLSPIHYTKMLGEKLTDNQISVWLINTGWIGGPYGIGERIKLQYTRAIINAAINKNLDNQQYINTEIFNLQVPTSCPGVPSEILNPVNTWKNAESYHNKSIELARAFIDNFEQYKSHADLDLISALPKL